MTKNTLHFKISSATKSILGKDLIVDKNIAIFELVKNSYDAGASRVDIYFTNNNIKIIDNGSGMSIDDIKNKWLFVGYSEKSNQFSEINKKNQRRRTLAGAKGIGRLACDRISKNLVLTTIKNKTVQQLNIKWKDFEKNSKNDFSKINILHETLAKNPYNEISKGTILHMSDLREKREENDILEIQKHLTKLISPIAEDKDVFEIIIHHGNKKISVENFVFQELGLKTTEINVSVSMDGGEITTELIDRGDKIYKIIEKNPWSHKIGGIKIQLLYMNRPTKISFYHLMKERTVDFGSIFLYNNGFRVFPYGEVGDDSLQIDRRKSQGYARTLGNRELIGYIAINNGGDNFKETSSRDGGLLNTEGYQELKELFKEKTLKRLEAYTIGTLNWTYNRKKEIEHFPEEHEKGIKELITKLTNTKDFLKLEYQFDIEKKINRRVNKEFQGASGILKREAQKSGNETLKKAVKKIERIQNNQKTIIQNQNKDINQKEIIIHKQGDKIEEKEKESTALRSLLSNPFFKNIVDFHHDISIASGNIESSISEGLKNIEEGRYENLSNILEIIKFENSKILSISAMATRSGMKDGVYKKNMPLNKKIHSYLDDYGGRYSSMKIKVNDSTKNNFFLPFRYHDIVTILENLLNNSLKFDSKNIKVNIEEDINGLEISYLDDGDGLDKIFMDNPSEILKSKISTTNGAGWGLYQVNELLLELGGTISVHPQKKGLLFKIYFKRGK